MKLLILFSLSFYLFFLNVTAQKTEKNPLDNFKNLKARSIGPAGMSGRVTSIDAVIANPDIIYIATASGGVWKTENAGANWVPIFDDQPILNMGAIAIQQSNPSVLWAGTGEGNPRNSISIGGGLYKSLDAGKTWKLMGLEGTKNIHRIIIDPKNSNTVYVGAIGNPYGIHSERGVFKTIDGGTTWKKILYTNDTSGVGDMIMDPSNPNKIFCAMWQHNRTPYSFNSGGKGSGLFVTYDGGDTWKQLDDKNGLPKLPYGRIGLGIARSMPNRMYALVEATKNGLYKSDDGGEKWELVNTEKDVVNNRPFYFQEIAVDPLNENRIYNIFQMISLSEDGGKNFRTIIPYNGIHPDHHAFWIHPTNPNLIIEGNDGGIGISRDRGKTWIFDEKIPVGQFYHVNVDNQLPYHIMGGLQDNGSWIGPAYTQNNSGIRNYMWTPIMGGDGFDVIPDPTNANRIYAMSQGGNLGTYNMATGKNEYLRPIGLSDTSKRIRFNWNAAFGINKQNGNSIYYGSQFVHKSINKGKSWQVISPDLTTNNKKQQDQTNNGGISIDITGAENFNTILAIEPSPLDSNCIWVGTDDGLIQVTKDGGKTWINCTPNIKGLPFNSWVPQIRAGKFNKGEAFVVANNYRQADFKPYIFRTNDYGNTWVNILENKKTNGYALCVIQDTEDPNLIFAGTEQGLYISLDNGVSFNQYKNNYPSVSTYDLAIQERESDLAIATFGRALYVIDDISPLRFANKKSNKNLILYPTKAAYMFESKATPGYEWSTWGLYDGDNRQAGAPISFYVNPLLKDTTKYKKMDSVTIEIYTANDFKNSIRKFDAIADTGFNKVYWNFYKKGIRSLDSPLPKKSDKEVRGNIMVAPGDYKVIITLGKNTDTNYLRVFNDPAIPFDEQKYNAQIDFDNKLNEQQKKLVAITDAIKESEEAIDKIETTFKNTNGAQTDSVKSWNKKMKEELKNLREFIMGKKQEKQGYGTVPQYTVARELGEAKNYCNGRDVAPNDEAEQLYNETKLLTNEAVEKAKKIFNFSWKVYQAKIEAAKINIFKNYEF